MDIEAFTKIRIHLSPIQYVIFVFKGVRKTAKAIGIPHKAFAIYRKLEPDFPGGLLPEHLKAKILEVADKRDLDINQDDLDYGRMVRFTEASFLRWQDVLGLAALRPSLEHESSHLPLHN